MNPMRLVACLSDDRKSRVCATHDRVTRWSVRSRLCCGLPALALLVSVGCIERTVTIRSEPEGARVFLNDQEVGRSPVKVPFTWYGDYEVVLRHRGYETLVTHHRIETPWYELPGIDLITECFVPFTVHDHHEMPLFQMELAQTPSAEEVVARAEEMRAMALDEGVTVEADPATAETNSGATPPSGQ